jgi:hypothetical protein
LELHIRDVSKTYSNGVQARKVVDSAGVETPVPMDDWVEVGVFVPAEEGEELGKPLYVQMHRIRSTEQTITVTVPRKPAHAGIVDRSIGFSSRVAHAASAAATAPSPMFSRSRFVVGFPPIR